MSGHAGGVQYLIGPYTNDFACAANACQRKSLSGPRGVEQASYRTARAILRGRGKRSDWQCTQYKLSNKLLRELPVDLGISPADGRRHCIRRYIRYMQQQLQMRRAEEPPRYRCQMSASLQVGALVAQGRLFGDEEESVAI